MALQHGSEHFTKWTHVENGRVLNRRLHRIELQATDGRLYVVTGQSLPDFIGTYAGHGYKGEHLMQILLKPNSITYYTPPEPGDWPRGRDVVHVGIGILFAILTKFVLSLLVASL